MLLSKVYSTFLKLLTIRLKDQRSKDQELKQSEPKIQRSKPKHLVWISNDFRKFIYQISIEFWIRNTLLQKFLQTDMIFFNQFKVAKVKFEKIFAESMISIALLKELGSYSGGSKN